MSPEHQALTAIHAVICVHRDADSQVVAQLAVEAIAAQGLVILTAARAYEMIDAERRARMLEDGRNGR
jgi:hypothetical protein